LAGRKTAKACVLVRVGYNLDSTLEEAGMANEKNFLTWKRQQRRRKSAKAKVKLYEQGKIKHDELPALAKEFLTRKLRFLTKSA
jgi:hypothetical protein